MPWSVASTGQGRILNSSRASNFSREEGAAVSANGAVKRRCVFGTDTGFVYFYLSSAQKLWKMMQNDYEW